MSRNLLLAALVSLLLHAGVAFGGRFFAARPAAPAPEAEIPTIALELPPPPEPDEPEVVENLSADGASAELSEISAPPMLADTPSAFVDSPFVQPLQPPAPPGITRAVGEFTIPSGPPRPGVSSGLKNIFDLAELDEPPRPIARINPVYPFDMRRSGLKGEVLVEFVVDTRGNVRDARIVRSSHSSFEQAALDAVQKWKFRPGRKAGAPQNTRVHQPLSFSLSND